MWEYMKDRHRFCMRLKPYLPLMLFSLWRISLLLVLLVLLRLFGLVWLIRRFPVIESHDGHKFIEAVDLSPDSQRAELHRAYQRPLTSPIIAAVSPSNSSNCCRSAFSILLKSHWSTSLRSQSGKGGGHVSSDATFFWPHILRSLDDL